MSTESEARKALARLQRSLEKTARELDAVRGSLIHAEGDELPAAEFDLAAVKLSELESFVDEQSERLADKILHTGGLEPGRIRRG